MGRPSITLEEYEQLEEADRINDQLELFDGDDIDADMYLTDLGKRPSDRQIGGNHYKEMRIQPTSFIEANKLGWCEGNAVKYICRHNQKGSETDILKAIHYLELLLEKEYSYVRTKDTTA
jgi:hypothetical protein